MESTIKANDARTWTSEYVKKHVPICSDEMQQAHTAGTKHLENGAYAEAAKCFEDVVHGLALLAEADPDWYAAPLLADRYALAQICLFGLGDRQKGDAWLETACAQARACGAERELAAIKALQEAVKEMGIRGAQETLSIAFPDDLL